jgi:hypothetical protein
MPIAQRRHTDSPAHHRPIRVRLSALATDKIGRSPVPRYRIAQHIDVPDSTLWAWLAGRLLPRRDDPRLTRLAVVLGLTYDQLICGGHEDATR